MRGVSALTVLSSMELSIALIEPVFVENSSE